jgi:hypothetical protein
VQTANAKDTGTVPSFNTKGSVPLLVTRLVTAVVNVHGRKASTAFPTAMIPEKNNSEKTQDADSVLVPEYYSIVKNWTHAVIQLKRIV